MKRPNNHLNKSPLSTKMKPNFNWQKMYLLIFFAACSMFISLDQLTAQNEICGTQQRLELLQIQDPTLESRMASMEAQLQSRLNNQNLSMEGGVITIPVVVHIVYHSPSENLSEAQILSQLDVINEDFRRLNADAVNTLQQFQPVASDPEIEFCLSPIDPLGNPSNGITRTSTSIAQFNSANDFIHYTSLGGKDAWPSDKYLNIWVCDIQPGLNGWAQYPGGPAATDGIIVDYTVFGRIGNVTPRYHLGRTTTHEIGHWLNLRHVWGSGGCASDDYVNDTPLSDTHHFYCLLNSTSCGSLDMGQNYMDYSDDDCTVLFTEGQKERMRAAINLFRPGLLTSYCGCPDNLTLIQPINSGTHVFKAGYEITASNVIQGITNVRYQAGERINMTNGFRVEENSIFRGQISACDFGKRVLSLGCYPMIIGRSVVLPADLGLLGSFNNCFAAVSVQPNPFTGKVQFSFWVNTASKYNLMLVDVLNRKVHDVMEDRSFDIGYHEVAIDVEKFPEGVYIYRLFGNRCAVSGKIVKVQ